MTAFTRAAREIQVIRSKARRPVGSAVRARMVRVVRGEGLTVERYNRIAAGVRRKAGLYARYQKTWRSLGSR
ncbi:MAG TPA: hypothetical protein VKA48_03165 [Gammaproteobacteria bacterium]|nr:hypothetical protein [Gammaproteobacteria bacterium]